MKKHKIISNDLWVDGTTRYGYKELTLDDVELAEFKAMSEAEQLEEVSDGEMIISDTRINDYGDIESFEILSDENEAEDENPIGTQLKFLNKMSSEYSKLTGDVNWQSVFAEDIVRSIQNLKNKLDYYERAKNEQR